MPYGQGEFFSRRCLSEFIDWRYSQSSWYFRTIAPLTFSLVNLPPTSPDRKKDWFHQLFFQLLSDQAHDFARSRNRTDPEPGLSYSHSVVDYLFPMKILFFHAACYVNMFLIMRRPVLARLNREPLYSTSSKCRHRSINSLKVFSA